MQYADSRCKYVEVFEPHGYKFTGPCVVTGKEISVTVPGDGLYRYRQGAHMQDAFPNLSADDREFLISGMSAEAWDAAFSGEDDDEDCSEDQPHECQWGPIEHAFFTGNPHRKCKLCGIVSLDLEDDDEDDDTSIFEDIATDESRSFGPAGAPEGWDHL